MGDLLFLKENFLNSMAENPFVFNPFRGAPHFSHATEQKFSASIWGINIAIVILHGQSPLGFRPYKFNKDLVRGTLEEAIAMKYLKMGQRPRWPYRKPELEARSIP